MSRSSHPSHSNSAAAWNMSLGCELQPAIFASVGSLREAGLLDHLQVTVPSTITSHEAREFAADIPVIAHCNLLNTFGSNDWKELAAVSRQVRSLRPIHVVEHFTAFRSERGEKFGVCFEKGFRAQARETIARVARWQDMLGMPLCLENVPIAADTRAYFDLLLEVVAATGCRVACDMPHFLLSCYSAGLRESEIESLAASLDAVQLHVGGLSIQGGVMRDNHKGFSPWIAAIARSLFPRARFVTLEQNHQIPAASVERFLGEVRAIDASRVPLPQAIETPGIGQDALNSELAADAARNNGYGAPVRAVGAEKPRAESALELYEKYLPFLFPVESVERSMDQLAPADAVRMVASLSRWSLSYLSWWSPQAPACVRVTFGQGDERKFSQVVGSAPWQDDFSGGERVLRFVSPKGFWVEAAAPRILELAADQNKGA